MLRNKQNFKGLYEQLYANKLDEVEKKSINS